MWYRRRIGSEETPRTLSLRTTSRELLLLTTLVAVTIVVWKFFLI